MMIEDDNESFYTNIYQCNKNNIAKIEELVSK